MTRTRLCSCASSTAGSASPKGPLASPRRVQPCCIDTGSAARGTPPRALRGCPPHPPRRRRSPRGREGTLIGERERGGGEACQRGRAVSGLRPTARKTQGDGRSDACARTCDRGARPRREKRVRERGHGAWRSGRRSSSTSRRHARRCGRRRAPPPSRQRANRDPARVEIMGIHLAC